jgi:prepilin-type N-terminal cleavage/methylation domain-containing protein
MKKGFTLIELLVVVAIIAVIGAGVAVTYGRTLVDDAKKQMTLHEMGQIRDAFQRFWADNASQMMDGLTVPGSAAPMPTADFAFIAGDTQTFNASLSADDPQRLYGALEFLERYGLWMLFQKSVGDLSSGTRENQIFLSTDEASKYEFHSPSPLTGNGWRGPYISTAQRVDCVAAASGGGVPEAVLQKKRAVSSAAVADGELRFPQPKTKYDDGNGGFYRVVYIEHCAEERAGQPIFRRLLLIAAQDPRLFDEEAEIARFRGNRRYSGADAATPIDTATGAVTTYDETRGVFFLELLNFDTVYR